MTTTRDWLGIPYAEHHAKCLEAAAENRRLLQKEPRRNRRNRDCWKARHAEWLSLARYWRSPA